MVPLEILVGICRAWKKEVFSGPRPVFWGSRMTSQGAKAPALAGAFTLLSMILSRTSVRSSLVNTKPTLPRMWGRILGGGEGVSLCGVARIGMLVMIGTNTYLRETGLQDFFIFFLIFGILASQGYLTPLKVWITASIFLMPQ